jgi:branched-chain amino acid transport system ATP-binding protein
MAEAMREPADEPFFAVQGLTAGYGEVRVLWGIDVALARGEIACLVGSNGAGKTTLLRCISGLVPAADGSIRFAGRDLTNAGPAAVLRAGIGHVPEGRRLFAAMSVEDNLLMGSYLRRDPAAAQRDDLEAVYGLFPILAERRRQSAGTLSGGEQQMCAIGRGLMSRPALLLIDELSLGLAPRAVDGLIDALREVNRTGVTILVVEQDVAVAFDLASRGFIVDVGRITRAGPTTELINDPAVREAYLGIA